MRYIMYIHTFPESHDITNIIYFHDIPNDIPVVFPIESPFWLLKSRVKTIQSSHQVTILVT